MGTLLKKRRPPVRISPAEELPEVFTDERFILSGGEGLQVAHYRQQHHMNKTSILLHKNVISFVIKGQKQVYHGEGKLTIQPLEGFFLKKGNYLGTERSPDGCLGYESIIILLSDEMLQTSYGQDRGAAKSTGTLTNRLHKRQRSKQERPDRVFHLRQDDLVVGVVQQLIQYFQAGQGKRRIEAVLPLKIREMMSLLISSPSNKGFDIFLKELAFADGGSLSDLMDAHFRESLTLEQWAFLAGLSLSSFKRKFESIYQLPPKRWIQLRRLQEAYRLLGDNLMNVTEVCYAVGFENPAHFVHAFKAQYHITPKQRQLAASK